MMRLLHKVWNLHNMTTRTLETSNITNNCVLLCTFTIQLVYSNTIHKCISSPNCVLDSGPAVSADVWTLPEELPCQERNFRSELSTLGEGGGGNEVGDDDDDGGGIMILILFVLWMGESDYYDDFHYTVAYYQ